MANKVETVSLNNLSKSIDKALKIATAGLAPTSSGGGKVDTVNLLSNWQIFGRLVRDLSDLNVAHELATKAVKSLGAEATSKVPASVKIGKDILVGFIEKASMKQFKSF